MAQRRESTCQFRRHRFDPRVRKIPWRRKWQPTPVFLLGKSHGQRSLAGYRPWGPKTVRHDLATKEQQGTLSIQNEVQGPEYSISLTWGPVEMQTLRLQPDWLHQELQFNELSRWPVCVGNFETHCLHLMAVESGWKELRTEPDLHSTRKEERGKDLPANKPEVLGTNAT